MANHPILESLMSFLKVPLITTSLHHQDEILDYTTDPSFIFESWEGKIDLMLKDGYGGNIPSTVIDLCESLPRVVRVGKGSLDLL